MNPSLRYLVSNLSRRPGGWFVVYTLFIIYSCSLFMSAIAQPNPLPPLSNSDTQAQPGDFTYTLILAISTAGATLLLAGSLLFVTWYWKRHGAIDKSLQIPTSSVSNPKSSNTLSLKRKTNILISSERTDSIFHTSSVYSNSTVFPLLATLPTPASTHSPGNKSDQLDTPYDTYRERTGSTPLITPVRPNTAITSPNTSIMADSWVAKYRAVGVLQHYPVRSDEILIDIGTNVIVTHEFRDGWASGFDSSTQVHGVFPLECVQRL